LPRGSQAQSCCSGRCDARPWPSCSPARAGQGFSPYSNGALRSPQVTPDNCHWHRLGPDAILALMSQDRPLKAGDHVFLVDGSSYIFRAYFAMFKAAQSRGRSFTRSDGMPIGGVLAFSNMLWKLLREGLNGIKPTHVAVVFD